MPFPPFSGMSLPHYRLPRPRHLRTSVVMDTYRPCYVRPPRLSFVEIDISVRGRSDCESRLLFARTTRAKHAPEGLVITPPEMPPQASGWTSIILSVDLPVCFHGGTNCVRLRTGQTARRGLPWSC